MASQTSIVMPSWSDREYQNHVVSLSRSKLKSSIRTSTLLAGFALVGIVEIEIHSETHIALLIPFAIVSAILIFVHLLSLMLAVCLLPELEALGSTPHPVMYNYSLIIAKSFSIQLCWVLSNIIGILLFLVELVLIAFVKFYPINNDQSDNIYAAVCVLVTIIILSIAISPIFVYHMRSLSKYKIQLHEQQLDHAHRLIEGINQQNTLSSFPPNTTRTLDSLTNYSNPSSIHNSQN